MSASSTKLQLHELSLDQRRDWQRCIEQRDALVKGYCRATLRLRGGVSDDVMREARDEAVASFPFRTLVPRIVTDSSKVDYRYDIATDGIEFRLASRSTPGTPGEWMRFYTFNKVEGGQLPKPTKARVHLWKDLVDNPLEAGILPDPEDWVEALRK